MAWHVDDVELNGTRDELLGRVTRRGEQLRRRRRLALSSAAFVVAAMTGTASLIAGGGSGMRVATDGPEATTPFEGTDESLPPMSGPISGPVSPATLPPLLPDLALPSPTSAPSSPSTSAPAAAPPVGSPPPREPASTTTSTVPSTTTTTVALPPPRCGREHLTLTVTADKPEFGDDEEPKGTSVVRNTSAVTCTYSDRLDYEYAVRDTTGTDVHHVGGASWGLPPTELRPGEQQLLRTDWCKYEACAPLHPPGDYRFWGRWVVEGQIYEAEGPFRILP